MKGTQAAFLGRMDVLGGLRASQHSTEVIVRIMGQSWGVIRRLGWFRSFWRVSGSPIKSLARGKTGFGGL